jgi:citrate lyase subunit beta/citryl-CoA lyase
MTSPARSYLYVPANRPGMLDKAAERDCDALIIDLEDSVPARAAVAARAAAAGYLRARGGLPGPEFWVRVRAGEEGQADLEAVVLPGLAGVVLAKAQAAGDVAAAADALDRLEQRRGLPAGSVPVMPLIESAAGVLAAAEIAAAPRVTALHLGEIDLAADLGAEPGPDGRELLWARSQVVAASAAAGLDPPLGPVSPDFADLAALRESTLALRRLGFRGRGCIHPAQVPVVNEVFTPTPAEVRRASQVVAAYEAAVAAGRGSATGPDGRMVDAAVVRAARRTLAAAR